MARLGLLHAISAVSVAAPAWASLTSSQKTVLLQKHNALRAGVTWPCTAADMEQLTWDEDLASAAESHAAKCQWQHDPDNSVNGWGENLAMSYSSAGNTFDAESLKAMVQSWYDEIADVVWFLGESTLKVQTYTDPSTSCKSYDKGKKACQIGHYTQVVWSATNKVGCAVALCSKGLAGEGGTYLVCKYSPAGNVAKPEGISPPYLLGEACAACSSCATGYGGTLCKTGDAPTRCHDAITTMSMGNVNYNNCTSLVEAHPSFCTDFDTQMKICRKTCKSCTVPPKVGDAFCAAAIQPGSADASMNSTKLEDSSSGCMAPADDSRGACESCFHGDQCPEGFYCCPYMRKCVDRGSMSCMLPIANCKPLCYDSMCNKTHGCNCPQCSKVGPGKSWDWIAWGNLENSATSTPTAISCTTAPPQGLATSNKGDFSGPAVIIQISALIFANFVHRLNTL